MSKSANANSFYFGSHSFSLSDLPKVLFIHCALVVLLFHASPLSAQKRLRTNFTSNPPVIDGFIGQEEWQAIDSATGFVQMEPRPGMPATEPTTLYVVYDSTTIYAAFIM